MITLQEAMNVPLGDYNEKNKNLFHFTARRVLRKLARRVGYLGTDYVLRNNKAGPAVSGEITLHTDHFYIQVAESSFPGDGGEVLYRSSEGRKDYAGGPNHWASAEELDDIESFILKLPEVLVEGRGI